MAKRKPATKQATTHARLAPSAFKGYEVCPSYLPDDEVTKAAERGEKLHGVLEEHAHKAHEQDELPAEDAAQLKLIAEYIAPFEKAAKRLKHKVLREHTFNLTSWKIDGCDRGTGDVLFLLKSERLIHLIDYKLGWWEVDDTEVNIQLGIYVLGCFNEFPWADTVMAHILQPARDEVSTHTFTRTDVTQILLRARTIADRVNQHANLDWNPTADTCLWCANKASCHALHGLVLQVDKQTPLALPAGNLDPHEFNDPKHAGVVYDTAAILEKWASAVKSKITLMAQEGTEVPDHELRVVSGKRVFVDSEGAYEVLNRDFNVSFSAFLAASNPSVTKLMAAVRDKAPQGQKQLREQEASSALMGEGVIMQNSPSAYLVRVKTKSNINK